MAQPETFIDFLAERFKRYADKLENQNHPRLKEWIEDCEEREEAGTPKDNLPPFPTWLKDKEARESKSVRKIRGENPPAANLQYAAAMWDDIIGLRIYFAALLIAFFFALLLFLAGEAFLAFLIAVGSGVGAYHLVKAWQKKIDERLPYTRPIPLDAYNTEFTCPLADRSMLRITVHFQIPRELNHSVHATYGAAAVPSHFVEQLNRVTEAKLITHTQQFSEPPSRFDIEDYLSRQLIQFQDENDVRVLRVAVPIAIHVHPDKPKGVHV